MQTKSVSSSLCSASVVSVGIKSLPHTPELEVKDPYQWNSTWVAGFDPMFSLFCSTPVFSVAVLCLQDLTSLKPNPGGYTGMPREGWIEEIGTCAIYSCSNHHLLIANSRNKLFLGFQLYGIWSFHHLLGLAVCPSSIPVPGVFMASLPTE